MVSPEMITRKGGPRRAVVGAAIELTFLNRPCLTENFSRRVEPICKRIPIPIPSLLVKLKGSLRDQAVEVLVVRRLHWPCGQSLLRRWC